MGDKKNKEKITTSDGHVLTEAEIKRQAAFDEKEKKLLEKGYERKDIQISVLTANFGMFDFHKVLDENPVLYFAGIGGILAASIVLTVVHEKIHGWFWTIGAENGKKDIEFGFQKETFTPYCTCTSPLTKSMYILGSMMPMTILGVVLGIVSIFVGSFILLAISVIQIIGGAGDIIITAMLLFHKTKGKDVVLLDHPTKIGLVAFEKEKEA